MRAWSQAEFPAASIGARLRHLDAGVRGDREQLIQAVLNIVRNAAQALAGTDAPAPRDHAAHAHRAPGDARQAALPPGTGIACRGQRAGRPAAIRDRIFYPLVSGREGGSGPRAHARADLRRAAPGHDRMRQRARPDRASRS